MTMLDESARRWLASLEERQRKKSSRQLAPWDENTWFQAIKETAIVGPAVGTAARVLAADPMRIAVIFSPGSGLAVQVSTVSSINAASGIMVSATGSPLIITQKDFGPLCTAEWFAFQPVGASLNILEIALRDWPQ